MQRTKEQYQTREYLQHEQWYHDVLQVSLHASPLEIEEKVRELAPTTTGRDLHEESHCLLNMDARRDYLKTLLVSDHGKDHVNQMVVDTKCVLARYQRDACIYSRDQAGNTVEEFVDSYEIVYEFDHDHQPVWSHYPAKISRHGFVHYINLDRSFGIISDGLQSDILIYFDIKAMDHRLCLEDLQVGDMMVYFPEFFEYLPSDKFRCASWVSEFADIFRVLPYSSTFAGECVEWLEGRQLEELLKPLGFSFGPGANDQIRPRAWYAFFRDV